MLLSRTTMRAALLSGGSFSPLRLFASGEQGVWYDPSDFTTMFQDVAGTTPVTAVEQPVRLLLDKSKGLVLGSELVANPGGPFVSTTGYSAGGSATISVDTGRLKVAQTVGFTDGVLCALPNNAFSTSTVISFTVDLGSSTLVQVQAGNGNFGNGTIIITNIFASGTYNITTTTLSSGASGLTFKASSASNFFLSSVSVKQRPGNHATQSTNGAQPVLSARVNLLTKTEQFDDAVWTKLNILAFGSGSVANATTAPNGTTTANLIVPDTTSNQHGVYCSVTAAAGVTYTHSVYAKAGGYNWLYMTEGNNVTAQASFNLSTGVLGTVTGTGSPSASITSVGNGWYRCTLTLTPIATSQNIQFRANNANGGASYIGNGTSGIYIWGADLRPTDQTTLLPVYQRVNTSTDYDTTGFPYYLRFDGTDDSMATGTITPGIDKAQSFAGVRKLSDATSFAIVAELSAAAGANNGSFALMAPFTASTYAFVPGGTVFVSAATGASFASPRTNVLTGTSDISGTLATLRVNGVQEAQNTGGQGAGNFLAYPLYIGSRSGSSLRFNGRIYSLIVRFGANLDATTITNTETWVNGKTMAY